MLPDLNLLPSLQALLQEKNVSRAAGRIGITQSAMSRSFARLRKELGDPLMVRVNNQYHLTSRAENLLLKLNQLMPDMIEFWQAENFDLTTTKQNIHIAGTDMDTVFVRQRINRIQKLAPDLRLSIRSNSPSMVDDLLSGEIDLLFTAIEDERAGLYRKQVTIESYVAVVRKTSQLSEKSLDLKNYLQHRHGMFSFVEQTRAKVDDALAAEGLKRNITLSLPTFSQIPPFLVDSDLIFSLPKSFAEYLGEYYPIKILPLPFNVEPLVIYLYWHQRKHSNKLHRWIREQLLHNLSSD